MRIKANFENKHKSILNKFSNIWLNSTKIKLSISLTILGLVKHFSTFGDQNLLSTLFYYIYIYIFYIYIYIFIGKY
jgi:hypothetical protein